MGAIIVRLDAVKCLQIPQVTDMFRQDETVTQHMTDRLNPPEPIWKASDHGASDIKSLEVAQPAN